MRSSVTGLCRYYNKCISIHIIDIHINIINVKTSFCLSDPFSSLNRCTDFDEIWFIYKIDNGAEHMLLYFLMGVNFYTSDNRSIKVPMRKIHFWVLMNVGI